MHIDHIAIWTHDISRFVNYYVQYFGATAGSGYQNPSKGFESVFLSFESGARIEVMRSAKLDLLESEAGQQRIGYTHLAISLGSEAKVDELTQQLSAAGFEILDGPRRTGDGYYESVTLDPDGNRIEITA